MKKLILLLVCLVMSLSVSFADDADFTIKNGILIKYTGKDEIATFSTLAGLIVVLLMTVNLITELFSTVKELFSLF